MSIKVMTNDQAKPSTISPARVTERSTFVGEVSVLRAFSIIGVVWAHVTTPFLMIKGYEASGGYLAFAFTNQMIRYSTGLFICISGFVLFHAYGNRATFPVWRYYRRRVSRVVIPYVAWTVLYYGIQLWPRIQSGKLPPASRLLTGLATRLTLTSASIHLYFFVVIIQFYLLFPLFLLLVRRNPNRLKWWVLGAFLLQLSLTSYTHYVYVPDQAGLLDQVLSYEKRLFPFYAFYFVLGAYLSTRLAEIRRTSRYLWAGLPLALGGAVALTAEFLHGTIESGQLGIYLNGAPRPTVLLYCVTALIPLWWLACRIEWRGKLIRSVLARLGTQAYGVFLVHVAVLQGFRELLTAGHVVMPRPITAVVTLVVVLPVSYAIAEVLTRVKITSWLVYPSSRPR